MWQKLQAGEVANVDDYADEGGPLPPADPRKPGDWQNSRRRLAPRFVEDLLLREPYRNELHRKGARIQGAWFNDQIDLEWAELARQIWLHRCRFEKSVLLTGLRTPHIVSFDSSAFAADLRLELAQIRAPLSVTGTNVARTLNMDSADIGQSLLMRSDNRESGRRAESNEVVLNGAKVGGQISLIAAKVASALKMDSIKVGRNLFMRSDSTVSAEFKDVEIRNAKIGGQVSLIGAKVVGTLDMDSVDIGGSLLMKSDRSVSEQRAELNDLDLRSAKVGGQVSLVGAKVAGTVNMYAAEIGESVFMRSDPSMSEHRAEFDSGVSLIFAEIGGSLDVQGAVLSSLDLTGTKIRADLRLALRSWSAQWRSGGRLVVRNTSVDAIQDTEDDGVWPESLVLDGFTYRRFGGLGVGAEARVARRGADWFVRWLAKDEPYAPQPAQQCAQVLREMGHPEIANRVLYKERERERKQAWRQAWRDRNFSRPAGLELLKWFVGYGYGQRLLWHPLACVVALVAIGTIVLHFSGVQGRLASWVPAAVYSFDTLLPVVQLEKSFADITFDGFAKWYFYGQKLMGWVLASFLVAGLSGIIK